VSLHYFHCTDGVSLFVDEEGASVVRDEEIYLAAMKRAEAVMRGLPSYDWSDWLVCVYDDLRQMVEIFSFPALRPRAWLDRQQAVVEVAVPELICAAGRGGRRAPAPLKPRL